MQGSIGPKSHLRFRGRLSAGSVYTLSGFDVSRSNPNFRLSEAPVSIKFNDGTSFEKVTEPRGIIPTEMFRLLPYRQLLELSNTSKQLPGNFFPL